MQKWVIFLFLFLSIQTKAQIIKILDELHFHTVMIGDKIQTTGYEKLDGSPYLTKDFVESVVYFRNDSAYRIHLRYNLFDQRMEYEYKNTIYSISNPEDIYKIVMGDKTFVYLYSRSNHDFDGYYQLLVDGQAVLLKRMEVEHREAEKPQGIYDPKPDRFIRKADRYYVLISGSEPKLIKNKKSLPEIFEAKTKELENFIKKEKISIKKEAGIIRLIEYYNSLNQNN